MKYKNLINLLIIALFSITSCTNSFSQSSSTKELTIGDKLPDLTLKTFVNTNYATAKISQFKGKLIIFDFWATWCSSCVKSMPKEDSLQSAFKGELQIFMVDAKRSNDPRKNVQITLDYYHELNGKKFGTPLIINDLALTTLFPHRSIPHCVWVDKSGTIIAITDGEHVTAQNIAKVLTGQPINFPMKSRDE